MIENKPIKNKDPLSNQISQLRNRISELENEIRWLVSVVDQSDMKDELKKRKVNVTNSVNVKRDPNSSSGSKPFPLTQNKRASFDQTFNKATPNINLHQNAMIDSLNESLNQERLNSTNLSNQRDA